MLLPFYRHPPVLITPHLCFFQKSQPSMSKGEEVHTLIVCVHSALALLQPLFFVKVWCCLALHKKEIISLSCWMIFAKCGHGWVKILKDFFMDLYFYIFMGGMEEVGFWIFYITSSISNKDFYFKHTFSNG